MGSFSNISDSSDPNPLLCRLRLTFEQIFINNQDHPLDKIEKIVKIWDSPLQPGACGSSTQPLVEFFAHSKETDFFSNVISQIRKGEKRMDTFYTVTNQVYVSKNYDDIFNKKDHMIAGQSNLITWGGELLWDNTKKMWPSSYTAILKRDFLKKEIGYYDNKSGKWMPTEERQLNMEEMKDQNSLLKDYLILGNFRSTNLFDYKKNDYVSVAESQIVKGSDDFYYMLGQMPKDPRDPNLVINKITIFRTRENALEARQRAELEARRPKK